VEARRNRWGTADLQAYGRCDHPKSLDAGRSLPIQHNVSITICSRNRRSWRTTAEHGRSDFLMFSRRSGRGERIWTSDPSVPNRAFTCEPGSSPQRESCRRWTLEPPTSPGGLTRPDVRASDGVGRGSCPASRSSRWSEARRRHCCSAWMNSSMSASFRSETAQNDMPPRVQCRS